MACLQFVDFGCGSWNCGGMFVWEGSFETSIVMQTSSFASSILRCYQLFEWCLAVDNIKIFPIVLDWVYIPMPYIQWMVIKNGYRSMFPKCRLLAWLDFPGSACGCLHFIYSTNMHWRHVHSTTMCDFKEFSLWVMEIICCYPSVTLINSLLMDCRMK